MPTKLTFNPSNDVFPLWFNDGQRIVFMSVREAPPQLFTMAATPPAMKRFCSSSRLRLSRPVGHQEGRTLFYTPTDSRTAIGDIMVGRPGDRDLEPVVKTHSDERYGTVSPDGKWLAYVSNESDIYEVNVRALHRPGVRHQISVGGGSQPQWRRDGLELVYMAPDRSLISVGIQATEEASTTLPPRRLFRTRTKALEVQGTARTYAISMDGGRFLVANGIEEAKYALISLVKNWRSSPVN